MRRRQKKSAKCRMLADPVPTSDMPPAGCLRILDEPPTGDRTVFRGFNLGMISLTWFSLPHLKQVSGLVTPGLRDIFAGREIEATHESKAVLMFVGSQSGDANSNAHRGQGRESGPTYKLM